nr:hypothetical protein [Actinomycetales bacterium]
MQLSSPAGRVPAGTAGLLALLSRSPWPALTQYGRPDGGGSPSVGTSGAAPLERVELSGKVIAQWAYKCANLLWEEGLGPGDLVALDVSPSWRAVPWALGTWLQGLTLSTTPDPAAQVTVTDLPGGAVGDLVVALTPDPLALAWEGDLPPGVLDGAADVAGQADLPLGAVAAAEGDVALADAGIRYGDLDEVIGLGSGTRRLVEPTSTWDLVRRCAAAWRSGGSVVVVHGASAEQLVRIRAQEGLTP